MTTVVISDTEGTAIESLELSTNDVLSYISLIKEFGYLGVDAIRYEFISAQVLDDNFVYVDVDVE